MMGQTLSGPYHNLVNSISTNHSQYMKFVAGAISSFKNNGTRIIFESLETSNQLEDFVNVYYGGDVNNFYNDGKSDLFSVALNNQWDGDFYAVIKKYYGSYDTDSEAVKAFLEGEYHSSLVDCVHDIFGMCLDSFFDIHAGGSLMITLRRKYSFDFSKYLNSDKYGNFIEFLTDFYINGCSNDNPYTKVIKLLVGVFSFIKRKIFLMWLKTEILGKKNALLTDIEALLIDNDFWVTTLDEYTDYYFSESLVIRYDTDIVALFEIMRDKGMLDELYVWLGFSNRLDFYNSLLSIIDADSTNYTVSSTH